VQTERRRRRGDARVRPSSGFAAIAAAVLIVAAGLLAAFFPSAVLAVDYTSQEIALVNLVNDYRESLALEPLMVSDLASDAAEKHSSDMGNYRFFSHTTAQSDWFPAGARGNTRLALCGYSYQVAWGENIAGGFSIADGVISAWKASADHNAVMTESAYRVVGVGLVYVSGSPYGFYWTMDFGAYVDPTAHWVGSPQSTTTSTTLPPSTTTTLPSPTTTTTTSPMSPFADVTPGSPHYASVCDLAADGIISGCADGLYHPERGVTRVQVAKMLILGIGAHTEAVEAALQPSFLDVRYTGGDYPFDYVEEAAALGIILGYPDGTFHPDASITRAQAALMLVRAGGDDLATPVPGALFPFTDVPQYAREAVAIAYCNQLIAGTTSVVFDPYGSATRGQVATMIYRLRQALGL
jgi:uncharacterized protein YkwD